MQNISTLKCLNWRGVDKVWVTPLWQVKFLSLHMLTYETAKEGEEKGSIFRANEIRD